MREYKFRGKRKDNGDWVYGYYLKSASAFIAVDDGLVNGHFDLFEVDPETVGQFTGLHNKNGKDIYEGDIVKCWFPGMPHNMRAIQEIMFIEGCFGCGDYPLKICDKLFLEVIGNKWDSPERLKEVGV